MKGYEGISEYLPSSSIHPLESSRLLSLSKTCQWALLFEVCLSITFSALNVAVLVIRLTLIVDEEIDAGQPRSLRLR
jgi:hypothetical protein